MMPLWRKYNVKPIGLGCDDVDSCLEWLDDIEDLCGEPVTFPLVADPAGCVFRLFCCLDVENGVILRAEV